MGTRDKLIERVLTIPKDLKWRELITFMENFGFQLFNHKGSRRKFIHPTGFVVALHEPHNPPYLKPYAIREAIEGVKLTGGLK